MRGEELYPMSMGRDEAWYEIGELEVKLIAKRRRVTASKNERRGLFLRRVFFLFAEYIFSISSFA
jgi:hypothetical protein